ncbi:universal stress protein [Arthrobacter bambusae]|uniref:universal stress protein n=1 Tax=Arthrobacter bambusae TaxID=1338426 RepID=UPI00277E704A|nr:universal stress protein [Arthrobacter bambusae]MDQ0212445.1 nucleotide-binding universal stress UspA family protein [Arthrobacter bambusae]MDQ0236893.1 nucleotide-binding universal stress UspA family protein [Arthrobacter bambusae]
MSGTIVVGVDGSPTARMASEAARDLASALGATLHVVSAFDSERSQVFGSGSNKWHVSDADKAEHVARAVADTLGGDIDKSIGRVLGSVANSVAHNAPCDVSIANTYDVD